jgi:hypothetical protein
MLLVENGINNNYIVELVDPRVVDGGTGEMVIEPVPHLRHDQ